MKKSIGILTLLCFVLGTARAESPFSSAAEAFDRLKGLVGAWEGETMDGKRAVVDYRLTGRGTSLVERYQVDGDPDMEMLTVIHPDGADLVLTHYCITGNQPRMRAVFPAGASSEIRFEFADATNLADPGEGHMHRAVYRLLDQDRMQQQWTFRMEGRDAFAEEIAFTRVE